MWSKESRGYFVAHCPACGYEDTLCYVGYVSRELRQLEPDTRATAMSSIERNTLNNTECPLCESTGIARGKAPVQHGE